MSDDNKTKDKLTLEKLYTQVAFLRTIIIISFVAGSCIVGLVFAHLWHDKMAFKLLNDTVVTIKEGLTTLNTELKRLHPEEK